jgi:hypothetical protein
MKDIPTAKKKRGPKEDYPDKRRDWDEDKRKRHEKQKEGCQKRKGAVDWHSKYMIFRAIENPTVSVAELYASRYLII